MKLTKEQVESMEYEEFKEKIKEAYEKGDKEFIMSAIPFIPDYDVEAQADDFEMSFDKNFFEDRDIAYKLAEYGQFVPKELYGDDEEIILALARYPEGWHAFDLASDSLLSNKEFVMRIFSNIDDEDYEVMEEMYHDDYESIIPEQVLEDGEVFEYIEGKLQSLKGKRMEQDKEYNEDEEIEMARIDYYADYQEEGYDGTFLDYLRDRRSETDDEYEKESIWSVINFEEKKEHDKDNNQNQSELQNLAEQKQELEQVVNELREKVASAQKLLSSYEKLLYGEKQNDSNEDKPFGEE